MRVLAVDPGLANTGLVYFESRHIAAAETIRTRSDGPRPDWARVVERGQEIAHGIREVADRLGPVDVVVCESYRDIPGRLRTVANRWTTPLVIGLVIPTLIDLAPALVWQDPERVMRAYAGAVRIWESGICGVVPGDRALTNEHLRSAAAHGLHYLDNARLGAALR